MSHLYRGELYRSTVWRTRLDTTTNWAVLTTGIALSLTFSSETASPLPLVLVGLLVTTFLSIEARRYRYFDFWRSRPSRESSMYAAIRQGKAKAGQAEELTRRIKEGAIPVISAVEGFMGYYVVYAPDDTVIAISLFNNYAAAEESNKRALAWIEQDLAPLLTGPATAMAGPVIVHTLA